MRDARVVDLYAGSGALGLEALSRGAATATFVEAASSAARVITANARELGVADRARVVKEKALSFLARADEFWDLALVDPPYDISASDLQAVMTALAARLAPDAVVVLEWSTRAGDIEWPLGLEIERERDYGDTRVRWARWGSVES